MLVATATSVIVTFVTEIVVQPKLEAIRARRALSMSLLNVGVLAARLDHGLLPRSIKGEVRTRFLEQENKTYEKLRAAVEQFVDDLAGTSGTYVATYMQMIMDYAGHVNGVLISARPRAKQGHVIKEMTLPLHVFLFGGLHPIRRGRALRQIRAYLAPDGELPGDTPAVPPQGDPTRSEAMPS